MRGAAERGVEPAPAQLGLAVGLGVEVAAVAVERAHDVFEHVQGLRQRLGPDQVQTVARRVVLGVLAMRRPRQPAHGQVEPGAVELALVVARRLERPDVEGQPAVARDDLDGAVDGERGVERPAARALVGQAAGVAQVGQDQAVADAIEPAEVLGQPGDGADGARREQHADRVPERRPIEQTPGERRRHGDRRGVVVGERWVARVRREQHLAVGLARDHDLAVAQRARHVLGVDDDLDRAVLADGGRQRVEAVLGQAEAPRRRVVRRPVRDQVGLVGEGVEVGPELGQRHRPADRRRVLDEVERAGGPVGPAAAAGGDVGLGHAPLVGDGPVQDRRPAGDLRHTERDAAADGLQGLAEPVARDAPAERHELGDERVQRLALGGRGRR